MTPDPKTWNVDFTLALHNRTGKYFYGRDIIDDNTNLIEQVYAWRVPLSGASSYLASRIVDRLWSMEVKAQTWLGIEFSAFGRHRHTIHMDPLTVVAAKLTGDDLVICHDLGVLTHPDLFEPRVTALYRLAYAKIGERRPRMVFVSRASEQAFIKTIGKPMRSSVIYPPLRSDVTAGPESPVEGINTPYLLTVGSLGHRKNQKALIDAFAQSGLHQQGVAYVLCGAHEPGAGDVLKAAEATPGVHVLAYVSDAQLRWLYRKATAFVLVSRLEGFGIPVAEAINHGLIPLVTRESVLEEVAGEAALTADSSSIDEMAAQMRNLVSMPESEKRQRQALLGKAVERFSRAEFKTNWRNELSS
ncbi:Glycosyltransferase involved in cell wall bisynthesis [Methylobacterium phyllostachyos]|uniref:Glycosyltransferase involved in cell wall bisynthesis n=1 Tax=Methylobacterium phyllostachyos TaxID=582672 RepID=A0A1G9RC76_9HYPH|nr:glycosyltransferase family 1 protein [Methylobacterium phyllostachyos]SDM20015.1 Glycosyltransferase involved in cell wall bisynthesis [Methylobacterium phyllostachyos]